MHLNRLVISKLLCLVTLLFSTSCSRADITDKGMSQPIDTLRDGKVLIIYLSRTQNTKVLAEIIHEQTSGDLVTLELVTPYPSNYRENVEQAQREQEQGFLPPLKTKIENMDSYEIVFLCYPTWGMQLPPPMKSFLSEYNFTGKIIVPVNSNGGYGLGNSIQTIKNSCPNSKFLKEFTTKGGNERDGILFVMEGKKRTDVENEMKNWLKSIGF